MSKHNGRKTAIDGPFVQLTRELIRSDAWRTRGINCIRFIDFLMIENMSHGSFTENGKLAAPYSQLEDFGIGLRHIAKAVREAEERGLVRTVRGGKKGRQVTEMSRYRLTFLKTIEQTGGQNGDKWNTVVPPTDEWKRYKDTGKITAPSCSSPLHLRAVA